MASPKTKAKAKAKVGKRRSYESYEMVSMNRADIKAAPYNPRTISDKARAKLLRNIRERGLMAPPVWNVRTGNLVSGHRRLEILDSLYRTRDYQIKIAKVDLSPEDEKSQNIFFNNAEAQGEWDLEKLEACFKDKEIDFETTGFDLGDIYHLFGDSPFIEQPDELIKLSEQLESVKAALASSASKNKDRDCQDFYLVVVFKNDEDRKTFTDGLRLPDNRYVNGNDLLELIHARDH